MTLAWDGTLTAVEFEKAALNLVKVWARQCPHLQPWTWRSIQDLPRSPLSAPVVGYLVLEDVHVKSELKAAKIIDEVSEADESEDPTTMHGCLAGSEEHLYTYHVIYNESYRVPMLFLHGRLPDGRPLQWHSLCKDLPVGSQQASAESRWTFLTQEDHPFLHRPWFALHPCGTSDIMSLVYSSLSLENRDTGGSSTEEVLIDKSSLRLLCETKKDVLLQKVESGRVLGKQGTAWTEKYILTWLSFACPAVGLTFPSYIFAEST